MSRLLLAVLAVIGVATATIPDYLTPISYNLTFQLDLDNPQSGFTGSNVFKFKTSTNLTHGITTIVLNSVDLHIKTAVIYYPSQKRFTIIHITQNPDDETVTLSLDQELAPSSSYTLDLEYEGQFKSNNGLFIGTVNKENYLGMNSYPVYAKRMYPCLDKPNLRAKYDINLEIHYERSRDPTIISGLIGTYKVNKNYKRFQVRSRYLSGTYTSNNTMLPPYGFFFTVGNYFEVQKGYTVYVPNDKSYTNSINQDLFDVQFTPIVSNLSTTAGLDLKLVVVPGLNAQSTSGYGIAAVSQNVGVAMPNYSTTTLKEQALEILKAAVKSFFAVVVSPVSWEEVWLTESISTYIASATLNQLTTTWKNWPNIEVMQLQQSALYNSWSPSSSPVIPKNLNTTDKVLAFLSDPAIIKGSAILAMLETLTTMPLTTFVGFVQEFQGKAASSKDFFDFYQKMNNNMNHTLPDGKTLNAVFSPWLTQTGYPFLTVKRSPHEVVVNKKRMGPDDKSGWMLPLCYDTFILNTTNSSTVTNFQSADPNFVWLDDKTNGDYTVVRDGVHTIFTVFNYKGPAPYRVLYDDSTLQYLSDKLKDDISFLQNDFLRSTLIGDSWAFAHNGQLAFTSLFDTLRYLSKERSLGPWAIVSKEFGDFWTLMYFSDLRLQFQNYVKDLMRPTFLEFGIDAGNADMEKGMLRKNIIKGMCDYNDETCRKKAKEAYNTYIVGQKSIADADIVDELYCNGLRDVHDGTIQEMFRNKYSTSLAQYEKKSLFYYLSCAGDEDMTSDPINNLLEDTLVSTNFSSMPADDMILGFKEIASKPQHYEQALSYFSTNFPHIRSTLNDDQRADLIRYLGSIGSTNDHINIFGNFSYVNSSDKSIASAVGDAVKSVKARKQFLEQYYDDIYRGLYGYKPAPTPSPTPGPTPTPRPSPGPTPKPHSGSSFATVALPALLAYCMFLLRYLV